MEGRLREEEQEAADMKGRLREEEKSLEEGVHATVPDLARQNLNAVTMSGCSVFMHMSCSISVKSCKNQNSKYKKKLVIIMYVNCKAPPSPNNKKNPTNMIVIKNISCNFFKKQTYIKQIQKPKLRRFGLKRVKCPI